MPARRRSLFAALVLTLGVAVAVPAVAVADSSSNSQFVSDTNSARSQHGLRAYAVSSDLTSIANRWAAHMGANRTLAREQSASGEVFVLARDRGKRRRRRHGLPDPAGVHGVVAAPGEHPVL